MNVHVEILVTNVRMVELVLTASMNLPVNVLLVGLDLSVISVNITARFSYHMIYHRIFALPLLLFSVLSTSQFTQPITFPLSNNHVNVATIFLLTTVLSFHLNVPVSCQFSAL